MFLPLDCGGSLFGPCLVIYYWDVLSSFAIILTRKREHDTVRYCLPTISVVLLFLMVSWIGLKCAIVVLPDHTHSLFMGRFIRVWYLSHNRAEKDQTRLHICTVSPELLKIALKGWDVDEGSGQFKKAWYKWHVRAANHTKKKGCR